MPGVLTCASDMTRSECLEHLRSSALLPLFGATLACLIVSPAGAQQGLTLAGAVTERALISAALEASPELDALRAEVDAARARASAAGFPGPFVLTGEVEDVPDGYDLGAAAVRIEIGREFLTGDRSAAAKSLAATDAQSAELALIAAERRLTAAVIRELARATAAVTVARRLAAEDSLLVSAEASLRNRFAVGDARYIDVLRLRTERLRVQNDRASAVANASVAREALLGLAGPAGTTTVGPLLESTMASLPTAVPDEPLPAAPAVDSLLAIAGEVLLARNAVRRAEATRAVVVAERRPRLAGSIGAQRTMEAGESSFGPVIGASITLPFTARRANIAATAAAESEVRAAEAALQATRSRVRAELSGALARYEAARERLAVYDAALLRGARQERETALAAYRTGDMSLIELLDFERALSRAEIEHVRARADAAEAYATLIAAASGAR